MIRQPYPSATAIALSLLFLGLVVEPTQAGADPVENFFAALQRPEAPAGGWEKYVADQLTNLGQLRRALEPSQIALLSRNPKAFAIVRTLLKGRLENLARDHQADPVSAQAAAELIGEMGHSANYRDLYGTVRFARSELWPSLERFAGSPNADVRAAALRAIGSLRPKSLVALAIAQGSSGQLARQRLNQLIENKSPLRTTLLPVLLQTLKSGSTADKRLAAQSMLRVMQTINDYWSRTTKQTIADFTDAEQSLRDAIVTADTGLQEADAPTHRYSLEALNGIADFVRNQPAQLKNDKTARKLRDVISSTGFEKALKAQRADDRWLSRKTLEYIANAYAAAKVLKPQPKLNGDLSEINISIPPPKKLKPLPPIKNSIPPINRDDLPGLKPVRFQAGDALAPDLFKALKQRAKQTAETLNDPNIRVRLAAIDFLEMMSGSNMEAYYLRPVVNNLTARLEDSDPFVRWAAARTLGRIGRVRLAQPDLPKEDPEKILEKVVKGLARLVDTFRERDMDVRANAAKGLERLAGGAKAARPTEDAVVKTIAEYSYRELTIGAVNGDREPRLAALRALKVVVGSRKSKILKKQAVYATPQIVSQLQDADSEVRAAAAEALGSFGPAASAAVPALLRAMRDSDSEVRQAASDALLAIRQSKPQKRL